MHKERLLSSYLIRFYESDEHVFVKLQNLRTGEQLSFETWLAAWAFLDNRNNQMIDKDNLNRTFALSTVSSKGEL